MEDSGIDSEDKLSASIEDITKFSMENEKLARKLPEDNFDVIFREKKSTTSPVTQSGHNTLDRTIGPHITHSGPANTCRILQRKLELKVERAKRTHDQFSKKSQTANLIPINRLPIPENSEKKPLVDYKSDNSDDDPEEISFFTAKLKEHRRKWRHPELSDNFSIQEMSAVSDRESDDDCGSQNLDLSPPLDKRNSIIDKFISCFNCKSLHL